MSREDIPQLIFASVERQASNEEFDSSEFSCFRTCFGQYFAFSSKFFLCGLTIFHFVHAVLATDRLPRSWFEWNGCIDTTKCTLTLVLNSLSSSPTAAFSCNCRAHPHCSLRCLMAWTTSMVGHRRKIWSSTFVT